jgi:uroporphyrinogen decarboxylase
MTPRERWQAVLAHGKPDRIPMDYWGTPEATAKLQAHLGCGDVWALYERLQIDKLYGVSPAYCGPAVAREYDYFGCRYAEVAHAGGVYRECVGHPWAEFQTIADVERGYTWPSADWFDYAVLPRQRRGHEAYPVCGGGSEPFLTYGALRGLELAFNDLLVRPGLVEYALGKLFDLAYEMTRRVYEALPGQVDVSYVAEDFGSQEGLLFAPRTIRQFFLPGMRRMINLAHGAGVRVMTHSDGAIRPIIPDLLALGVDILNPIQWRCAGMERAGLARDFGGQVVFHGGVDNQQTLAFGTPEDVEREVAENIAVLGAGGGDILAPCHNIQAVSPVENVVRMYAAGCASGR